MTVTEQARARADEYAGEALALFECSRAALVDGHCDGNLKFLQLSHGDTVGGRSLTFVPPPA